MLLDKSEYQITFNSIIDLFITPLYECVIVLLIVNAQKQVAFVGFVSAVVRAHKSCASFYDSHKGSSSYVAYRKSFHQIVLMYV